MVAGISQAKLDWMIPGVDNSIRTHLYHIALIQMDYLCPDIQGRNDYWAELIPLFPFDDRDEHWRHSVITSVTIDEHLARLLAVQERFLADMAVFDRAMLSAPRHLPHYGYDISPEWTLHHVMQHEAQHRGEIGIARSMYASRS